MSEEKVYEPNSHKYRQEKDEEKKEINKPVAKGVVKQSEMKQIANSFISEDVHNVKSYIIMDVLIPAAKKAISDVIVNGIDMILYGESGGNRRRGRSTYVSYSDYSRGYDSRDRRDSRRDREESRNVSTDEVIFDCRADAEDVLSAMEEILDHYGVVRVADFYELADVSTSNWTGNKFGWTSLRNAEIQSTRDGYIIKFPRAYALD